MDSLEKKVELWLFSFSYRQSKVQIQSTLIVVIYFLFRSGLGLPILMLIRLTDGKIHSDILNPIKEQIFFQERINNSISYIVESSIMAVIILYVGVCVKTINSDKEHGGGLAAHICAYATLSLSSLSLGVIVVASQILAFGVANQEYTHIAICSVILFFFLLLTIYWERIQVSFSLK